MYNKQDHVSPLYASPLASCWNTSTYRLRMLRFAACDLGLTGGGVEAGTRFGGGGPAAFGRGPAAGGESGSESAGARRERIRIGAFVVGSEPKSIADAERTGGPEAGDAREPLFPGEAV